MKEQGAAEQDVNQAVAELRARKRTLETKVRPRHGILLQFGIK